MIWRQKQVTEDDEKKHAIDIITQLNLVKVEIEAAHERKEHLTKTQRENKTRWYASEERERERATL